MTSETPVMTVLEARVPSERWPELVETYKNGAARLPPQMIETFLVQSAAEPSICRITSVWQSRSALEDYRRSVDTPGGVLMFRAVGAEPQLTIWEVSAALRGPASPNHVNGPSDR